MELGSIKIVSMKNKDNLRKVKISISKSLAQQIKKVAFNYKCTENDVLVCLLYKKLEEVNA